MLSWVSLGIVLKEVVTLPSLRIIMAHRETKTIPIHMSIVTETCRYKLGTPHTILQGTESGKDGTFYQKLQPDWWGGVSN